MATDDPGVWRLLDDHLKQARSLLRRVSPHPLPSADPSDASREDLISLYRTSELRANRAEVELARVKREADLLRSQTGEALRQVQRLAYQDPVTGLANMNLIRQHLDSVLKERPGNRQTLLMLVDLDRFHVVNEVLGNKVGDALLVRVGERLGQLVGPADALGRRGEDEFLLVFSDVPLQAIKARAAELAENIRSLLSTPFLIDGQKFDITVSVGASYYPELADSAESLLQQADSALAYVKKQGRDQFFLYSSHLKRHLQHNATLEFQMRQALGAGEFFLEYLPVIKLEGGHRGVKGRLVGAEALIRWNHRVEGVLPPAQFLALAENSGFIVEIGHWVLEQVCRQLRSWSQAGVDVFVSVNLSGRQLLQVDLVDEVQAMARAQSIDPGRLSFEIHENFTSLNEERIDLTLGRLQSAGFALAIDDFGSGFSSLQRLARARFLKLASRLVQGDQELCRRAIAVAAGLDLKAMAIGVEKPETARFLLANGCSMVQGYHFSKPIDADEVARLSLGRHEWKL